MDLKKHLEDQAAVAAEAVSQYDADLTAARVAGIEEGRGQIQLPEEGTGEKLYTQEQISEAVTTAISNERIASKAELDKAAADLEAAQQASAALEDEHKQAMADLKKDIARKIKDANVDDMAIAADLEKEEEA